MYRETTFDCFKPGKTPGKRGAAEGEKGIPAPSATTRTRPRCQMVHFGIAGGNVNFSRPKGITPFDPVRSKKYGPRPRPPGWVRRYSYRVKDLKGPGNQIQRGRSSCSGSGHRQRTREAGCSSLRPNYTQDHTREPLGGTHCLESCRALRATTVRSTALSNTPPASALARTTALRT